MEAEVVVEEEEEEKEEGEGTAALEAATGMPYSFTTTPEGVCVVLHAMN